ncbi:MAG: tyrosine-type recombinase/integrase [Desulfobacterales bacterium]
MAKRIKVEGYKGIFYRMAKRLGGPGEERVYYAVYKDADGKLIETKLGRQYKNRMTPAKAAKMRSDLIEGRRLTRQEEREKRQAEAEAEEARWTVQRLWEEYQRCNPELKGWRTYRSNYHKHIEPVFGKQEPHEILPLDIDRFRLRLSKTHAAQSVKHSLNLLRRIINFGQSKGLCAALPFKIKFPRVSNEVTEDLSTEQLSRLLEAIEADDHPQAGDIMKMALYLGLRKGEIFRLKWEHIDFRRGFVRILDPKRGEDATIPLNSAARRLLESIPKEAEYVFPGRAGGQRTTIAVQARRIRKAAGLPDSFRPLHGLRHHYASLLASSGKVDMFTLQRLLTHKDPKMTARYAHLRDDALQRAAELAGELIEASTGASEGEKGETANG